LIYDFYFHRHFINIFLVFIFFIAVFLLFSSFFFILSFKILFHLIFYPISVLVILITIFLIIFLNLFYFSILSLIIFSIYTKFGPHYFHYFDFYFSILKFLYDWKFYFVIFLCLYFYRVITISWPRLGLSLVFFRSFIKNWIFFKFIIWRWFTEPHASLVVPLLFSLGYPDLIYRVEC